MQVTEPFNGEGKSFSVANLKGYNIPMDNKYKNMLTSLKCEVNILCAICYFTISEIEVWEVIFEK